MDNSTGGDGIQYSANGSVHLDFWYVINNNNQQQLLDLNDDLKGNPTKDFFFGRVRICVFFVWSDGPSTTHLFKSCHNDIRNAKTQYLVPPTLKWNCNKQAYQQQIFPMYIVDIYR
jgi:hypothetical protein